MEFPIKYASKLKCTGPSTCLSVRKTPITMRKSVPDVNDGVYSLTRSLLFDNYAEPLLQYLAASRPSLMEASRRFREQVRPKVSAASRVRGDELIYQLI